MIFFDIHLDMKFDRTQKNSSHLKKAPLTVLYSAAAAVKMNESGKGWMRKKIRKIGNEAKLNDERECIEFQTTTTTTTMMTRERKRASPKNVYNFLHFLWL